jgi:hypothetical protein
MLFAGITAYYSIVGQRVAGYPNSGQINLYVVIPVSVVALLLLGIALANLSRRGAVLLGLGAGVSLVAILPYLMVFGGGV